MYMVGGGNTRVHWSRPRSYDRWARPSEIKEPFNWRLVFDIVLAIISSILALGSIFMVLLMC